MKLPLQLCAWVISRFSRVRLFATLWTVARQVPLSMGFSRQEYWSGLPCPSPGDLPIQGSNPHLLRLLNCRRLLYLVGSSHQLQLQILNSSVKNSSEQLCCWLLPSDMRTTVAERSRITPPTQQQWTSFEHFLYASSSLNFTWPLISSSQQLLLQMRKPKIESLHNFAKVTLLVSTPGTKPFLGWALSESWVNVSIWVSVCMPGTLEKILL